MSINEMSGVFETFPQQTKRAVDSYQVDIYGKADEVKLASWTSSRGTT
jgi:hypothetical protein